MTPPTREQEVRKALLDEYAALKGSRAGRRMDEIERLLGLGKYQGTARRSKGG